MNFYATSSQLKSVSFLWILKIFCVHSTYIGFNITFSPFLLRYGEVPPPPHDYQLPIPDEDTVFHYKFVKEVSLPDRCMYCYMWLV